MSIFSTYDAWSKDNEPHGKADVCTFEVERLKVWAKLDCYDKHDHNNASEDPAGTAKTLRIGTVMFPEEY
jgi:hypothetical protein